MKKYNIKNTGKIVLSNIRGPSSYLGNEINARGKDISKADVTFALVFPDLYQVGMSNHGCFILYSLLNKLDFVCADRVYVPGADFEKELKNGTAELAGIESGCPLNQFDIAGFSLQYEMCYTNVLNILSLAGIPLYSYERDDSFPVIIGGGPSVYNPEPMANFFDMFIIGDGEEAVVEVISEYRRAKQLGLSKKKTIELMVGIEGVYCPSLFEPQYDSKGELIKIVSQKDGYEKVRRRIFYNINDTEHLSMPLVPYANVIHDRLSIEIDRGCTQGCRFCQAGYTYRPLRERDNGVICRLCQTTIENTGYEELSLLSLNSGRHSGISCLVSCLIDGLKSAHTSVSLPSMRPDTIDDSVVKSIASVKKTGFTIAPEAGSQRLRDIINKEITDDEIITAVESIFSGGWDKVKLYFMIGLPFEEMEDITAIYSLVKRILINLKTKRLKVRDITVSLSCFVPKPHTPFERCAMDSIENLTKKQMYLKGLFKKERSVTLKYHDIRLSVIEAIMSRGDRRIANVIYRAHQLGCKLDGWSEFFNFDMWNQACKENNISILRYANREIPEHAPTPWDHIDTGVSKKFLKKEWNKAKEGTATKDCREGKCNGCGLLCVNMKDGRDDSTAFLSTMIKEKDNTMNSSPVNYLLVFQKTGLMKYLSHLEFAKTIHRVFRRSKVPLVYSSGHNPRPKISFQSALPVGMEGLNVKAIVSLTGHIPCSDLVYMLNRHMPKGIIISEANIAPEGRRAVFPKTEKIRYLITVDRKIAGADYDIDYQDRHISSFLERDIVSIYKKGRKVNIRPCIEEIRCAGLYDNSLELDMTLKEESGITVNPYKVLEQLYGRDNSPAWADVIRF